MQPVDVKTPSKIGQYILRGVVGDGAFSVVKLCQHVEDKKYYACKIVPKSRLNNNNLEKRFEIEIRIDQQLHHPGIVGLVDILQDKANYYVIMEFCPNGELFQYIVDRKHLSEEEAKSKILEIMDTVHYIHRMGIAHRDLKPENILVDEFGHLKISDFGLSRFLGKNNLVETPCGSPCYASPECISGRAYNGKTNDVWGCGVILYAMVTGQLPWTKRNQNELFEQIRKGEYSIPSYLSKPCRDLIQKMMTVDTSKRITLEKAMQHPWLLDARVINREEGTKKVISLKKIDDFFRKKADWEGQVFANMLPRQLSADAITLGATLKFIKSAPSAKPVAKRTTTGVRKSVRRPAATTRDASATEKPAPTVALTRKRVAPAAVTKERTPSSSQTQKPVPQTKPASAKGAAEKPKVAPTRRIITGKSNELQMKASESARVSGIGASSRRVVRK